jgi:hypothetical protein
MGMLRDEALVYHSYDISQSERQFLGVAGAFMAADNTAY